MLKKCLHQQEPEDLIPNEGSIIPDDADEKFFRDESNFIQDTPYVRPINEKFDKDGLYLMHHYLICYLAILSGYFPNEEYPTTKAKCLQYYANRGLSKLGVNALTFYKSYSEFVNTYLIGRYIDIDKYETVESKEVVDEREIEILRPKRKKYLSYRLIEECSRLLELWYPDSRLFIQTLQHDPYRLDTMDYYWVYREIQSKYDQSMRHFVEDNCPHIVYNTFKAIHLRHFKDEVPSYIREFITPYIAAHYPKALD